MQGCRPTAVAVDVTADIRRRLQPPMPPPVLRYRYRVVYRTITGVHAYKQANNSPRGTRHAQHRVQHHAQRRGASALARISGFLRGRAGAECCPELRHKGSRAVAQRRSASRAQLRRARTRSVGECSGLGEARGKYRGAL